MVEGQGRKVESEATSVATSEDHSPPAKDENQGIPNGVAQEKSPAIAPVSERAKAPISDKITENPVDKGAALERLGAEKRNSLIKAWEENEKAKIENKVRKKFSDIRAWENIKKASVESRVKMFEEKIEKMKADYGEKMSNRVAEIHKAAEQKRAQVEAKRGERLVKVEETAGKYRASGYSPKKLLGCFGG